MVSNLKGEMQFCACSTKVASHLHRNSNSLLSLGTSKRLCHYSYSSWASKELKQLTKQLASYSTKQVWNNVIQERGVGWLYRMWQEMINHNTSTKWIPGEVQTHKWHMIFLPRFSAYRHASPCCVNHTLGGLVANRCFTNLSQHLGPARTYPQVRVTQWHEQFTKVPFSSSWGEGQEPAQITRRWPQKITNSCQCPSTTPSCLGGSNHQE
jgi:hypothetical protein